MEYLLTQATLPQRATPRKPMSKLTAAETHTEEAELLTLERLWHSGYFQRHIDALERFYRSKREEFRKRLQASADNGDLVELAKFLVVENGCVDLRSETLDQIKEIESEIWIQGELGNHDRERIAEEWTDRYAQSWRQWRLKEYLFAIERMEAKQLADCIQHAC